MLLPVRMEPYPAEGHLFIASKDTAKVEKSGAIVYPSLRRKDLADLHENKCCTGTLATGFGISESIKVTTLDKYVASEKPSSVQIKAGDEKKLVATACSKIGAAVSVLTDKGIVGDGKAVVLVQAEKCTKVEPTLWGFEDYASQRAAKGSGYLKELKGKAKLSLEKKPERGAYLDKELGSVVLPLSAFAKYNNSTCEHHVDGRHFGTVARNVNKRVAGAEHTTIIGNIRVNLQDFIDTMKANASAREYFGNILLDVDTSALPEDLYIPIVLTEHCSSAVNWFYQCGVSDRCP